MKPPDTRNRADEARKRLGVKQEDVDAALKIGYRLREVGLTTERVVEILDADSSDESRAFIARYRTISRSDLSYLSIEELCLAAGLTTRRLWELISGARLEQSQDIVKLIIADSMPRVVSNAVKAATEAVPIMDGQGQVQGWTYGDMKATDFLGKVSGLLPVPKGVSAVFNVGAALPIPSDELDDGIPLPSMDSALKEIQQIITTAPQLEAPKEHVPFIQEAEYEDIPTER
jgi:hypothetical protein